MRADAQCRSCHASVPPRTPCREYRGPKDSYGYGLRYTGEQRPGGHGPRAVKLSRWVVAQILGWDAIEGRVVRHHCDNPPCFRYDHHCVGSQAENVGDMHDRGRARSVSMPGERNPNAKLTEDQVRYIRTQKGSRSSIDVGREMGIAHSLVRAIWLGTAWRHLS